ncbi:MAG: hypothetical protein ACRD2B_18960 [Terriglobia bacterium]
MGNRHPAIGILILAALIALLAVRYAQAERRQSLSWAGWAGAAVILAAEVLLGFGVRWAAIYFTPLAWTGYLLVTDSLVASLQGTSLFRRSPRGFFALAAWSVPLWVIFEIYNLRLKNWTYVGLPANVWARDAGYVWSFSTIWPAIFETAELAWALGFFRSIPKPRASLSATTTWGIGIAGALCVTVPLLLPSHVGSYLFGLVWIGFALLLDPLNARWKGRSLLREWKDGRVATLKCFIFSGIFCGFLWEFWNYWAHARWVYIFPILQRTKIFEMPAPGFLGFPPFAVECLVMYEFLRTLRLTGATQIMKGSEK